MPRLLDRVRVNTTTTGTGTVTLGTAVTDRVTFAGAGARTGQYFRYIIEDGTAWEIGTGFYNATGPTLTRMFEKSSTGALLNLSGAAIVSVIMAAADDLDFSRAIMWAPQPGGTLVTQGFRFNAVAAGGTSRTPAQTNQFTMGSRIGLVTTTTAQTVASLRSQSQSLTRGNAAGIGGFEITMRFGVAHAAALATARIFVGLRDTGAAATMSVNPSDGTSGYTNMIGVGKDDTDTVFALMHSDGARPITKTAFSASFPANTLSTDVYDLTLSCAPFASSVDYRFTRVLTGDSVAGTITTKLPAGTVMLAPHFIVGNGGTAQAAAIDAFGVWGSAHEAIG